MKPALAKIGPYDVPMARNARSDRGPRPKQGAHLLTLREQAGLTQVQLAEFVGVPQGTIAFWEWSETPPRSNVLPLLAKAFRVDVADILITTRPTKKAPTARKPGPVSEMEKAFEKVRQLPRHQQRKILETVTALVDQYKRKAS